MTSGPSSKSNCILQCIPHVFSPSSDPGSTATELSKGGRLIQQAQGLFVNASEVVTMDVTWISGPPLEWDVPESILSPHPFHSPSP